MANGTIGQSNSAQSATYAPQLYKCKTKTIKTHYAGIPRAAVVRLIQKLEGDRRRGREYAASVSRKQTLALGEYYDERLAALGCAMSRGYDPGWLTYEADIGVLDFFAHDGTYYVPETEETTDTHAH